jgi:D-glycero-D-manno-heptose 1,7-bisphosphate phosphatase
MNERALVSDLGPVTKTAPVLFLDIDGVVRRGHKDDWRYVNGPDDVVVFQGAIDFISGWQKQNPDGAVVGVSNQPAISIGHTTDALTRSAMDETNRQTGYLFDFIVYCPHWPANDGLCSCRKPGPGMLIGAANGLSETRSGCIYSLSTSLMIGDRLTDAQAAAAAGVRFALPEWSPRIDELRLMIPGTTRLPKVWRTNV